MSDLSDFRRMVYEPETKALRKRIREVEGERNEALRALRWMAVEWAKWAEDTTGEPTSELVEGGIEMAMEAARGTPSGGLGLRSDGEA